MSTKDAPLSAVHVDALVGRLRAHAEAHEYIANADPEQKQWMNDLYDAADWIERVRKSVATDAGDYEIASLRECADQLRCHPASRDIRDIEAAGEMLRWACDVISRLRSDLAETSQAFIESEVKRSEYMSHNAHLDEQLSTQRAGVRAVIGAAVALVCAPGWAGLSDEDVALEQALRAAGLVTPNAKVSGRPPHGTNKEE